MADTATREAQGEHEGPGRQHRTWLWFPGILLIGVLIPFVLTHATAILGGLDEWTRDIRIAILSPAGDGDGDSDIVILGVSDDTLDQFACRLPVDRAFLADIVTRLDAAGARAIGIDFVLDNRTDPEKDEALRAAIARSRAPVVPVWTDAQIGTVGERAETLAWFVGDSPTGYGMVRRDRIDGTIRYHYPVWNEDGPVTLQFPASLAAAAGVDLPEGRRHRIAWRGQDPGAEDGGAFPRYDAHFLPVLPPEWFKDKIVLIGPVLVDIDRHRTPFTVIPGAEEMPGIEVHAHILGQLLDGRFLLEPGLVEEALICLVLAAGGLLLALSPMPLWLKLGTSALVMGGYGASAFILFEQEEIMVPVVAPPLALMTAAAMTSAFVGRRERQQRAQIRHAFARYVPPTVVARLDRDPGRLKLGGDRRVISVMFTDIEGFTSSAENQPPDVIGPVINDYFDGLGGIILQFGGTIDKFLGDGSMSFFGAPESAPDDAERALACARALQTFGEEFRRRWAEIGFDIGRTRVGLDTGLAVVGNFGGRQRFDYTAIGDVVNTAARLESANKVLGTRALVSAHTVAAAPNFPVRPVGRVVLSGKQQALAVFEPLSPKDADTPFAEAYRAAYALLDVSDPAAAGAFARLADQNPEDRLVAFYRDRLQAGESGTTIVLTAK